MRRACCRVFFLCQSLFLLPIFLSGASLQIEESTVDLMVRTANYDLRIQKSDYKLEILSGGKVILNTPAGSGRCFVRGGKPYHLVAIKDWRPASNSLNLLVSISLSGIDAQVQLTFFQDHLQVQVQASDRQENQEIGESLLLQTGGHWYGGNVTSAHNWPLESGSVVLDPFYSSSNQTSPLWLTSSGTGIFVPTYQLMGFSINKEKDGLFSFHVKDSDQLSYQVVIGRNIVDAYYSMIRLVGKPKQVPPREYFVQPIFNSWIEFHTEVNQKGLEAYVDKIRSNSFPCKIVVIDDKWTPTYGDFAFDPAKFPNPKAMIDRFHSLGLKVILWATPFIEQAAKNYRVAEANHFLIMDENGKAPHIATWWNGQAALVDLSNPRAYDWFLGLLQDPVRRYGVDGYKLDGGDGEFLSAPFTSFGRISSLKYTDLYASLGRFFDINELRVSWLVQESGLVQRLRDKDPTWSRVDGLNSLIPHGLTEGLIGYQYFCPDIIGGGLDSGFFGPEAKGIDAELFVRWTEASALMPMMQFSYAPWRMDQKAVAICRKYSRLHEELGDYIFGLAQKASQDGSPIVRPLFFRNPEDAKTYSISDQFMLGERFLVAPVLEKGASARDIYLPQGTWVDFWNGRVYSGGQSLKSYPAPLEVLPVFTAVE